MSCKAKNDQERAASDIDDVLAAFVDCSHGRAVRIHNRNRFQAQAQKKNIRRDPGTTRPAQANEQDHSRFHSIIATLSAGFLAILVMSELTQPL